jgi:hypothetical protein
LSSSAFARIQNSLLAHGHINAQTVKLVNARSANRVPHHGGVGKRTESEPSPFWSRLMEAWRPKGLPTSQNGVATQLDMSQGSTRRWFLGEGYPETDVLKEIAELGEVTVDWLLSGELPKSRIAKGTPLGRLVMVWEQLDAGGRDHVYQAAVGQLALQEPIPETVKKTAGAGSGKTR